MPGVKDEAYEHGCFDSTHGMASIFGEFAYHVETALERQNYKLYLCNSSGNSEKNKNISRWSAKIK